FEGEARIEVDLTTRIRELIQTSRSSHVGGTKTTAPRRGLESGAQAGWPAGRAGGIIAARSTGSAREWPSTLRAPARRLGDDRHPLTPRAASLMGFGTRRVKHALAAQDLRLAAGWTADASRAAGREAGSQAQRATAGTVMRS